MFNAPVAFNSDVKINSPLSFKQGSPSAARVWDMDKTGTPGQNALISSMMVQQVGINFSNISIPDAFEYYAGRPTTVGINVVKKATADQTVYHMFEHSFPTDWGLISVPCGMASLRSHKCVYEFRQIAEWALGNTITHGAIGTPDDDTVFNAPFSNPVKSGLKFFAHYMDGDPAYDQSTAIEFQSYATCIQQSYDQDTAQFNKVMWHFEKDWTIDQIGAGWNNYWWGYAMVNWSYTAAGMFLVREPGSFLWLAPMYTGGDIRLTGFHKTRGQDGGHIVNNPTIIRSDVAAQFAPLCKWIPSAFPHIDSPYTVQTDVLCWQYMHFPDNAQWTLSTDTPWITLTCPLAGTGDTKGIRLTAPENTGPARYGRIRADATWMDNGSPCRAYQYLGVVQQAKPEPPPPTPAA